MSTQPGDGRPIGVALPGWQRDTTFYHYGLLFDTQADQG